MAADIFVQFKNKNVPPKDDIQKVLEDFLGEAGKVEWDKDRFYATLQGKPSWAFKRVFKRVSACRDDERWFEVWIGDDCLDIITRQQDHYTNALADGFAKLAANFWDGKVEI